jgi:hypothetical protein
MHIDIPVHHWVFLPGRHFGDRHQERYHMGTWDKDRLYHNSRPIETTAMDNERNTRFFSGPEVQEVRKAAGRDFKPVAISEKRMAGQTIRNERLEIYRPKMDVKAKRVEKTRPVERYSPAPEQTKRSEKPAQYNSKPVEKKMQPQKSTRNENIKPGKQNTNGQSIQRQYSNQVKVDKKVVFAERKTSVSNNGTKQQNKPERRK